MNISRILSLQAVWLAEVAYAYLAFRADQTYRLLPALPPGDGKQHRRQVSVIIPARNEEHNLARLLGSVLCQTAPVREVIVVDDASTDRTADLASAYGATVLKTSGPPPGWAGKPHACQLGAQHATGEWLLFVDADVSLSPGALAAALTTADQLGVGALSLFARQRLLSQAERLLLPIAYQLYCMGFRDTGRVANGQFLLVRKDVYDRAGGHESVRDSVIEDVIFAEKLADIAPVRLLRGERWIDVRMYQNLGEIAEGFGKNAARFIVRDPIGAVPTIVGSILGTMLPMVAFLGLVRGRPEQVFVGLVGIAVAALGLLPWIERFGLPHLWALSQPVAAMTFQGIALRSLLAAVGMIPTTWKGRTYTR